ncbi:MAG: acetate--CoA ligase family protein [Thermodesulfobacteriota bacterium]
MSVQSPSAKKHPLSYFFEPEKIGIIGLLREGFFGGYVAIKTLLRNGFNGEIYPINPSYKEILGLKVYPSVKKVPSSVDLVLIITGRQSVVPLLKESVEKGVKAAIIVSDGFSERDEEGARLQSEIIEIAKKGGIRILGPNTAGIANPSRGILPNPYELGYEKLKPGGVALCGQTGMLNPQAFPYGDLGYGVSKICDFGNKCDVNECDLMEFLEEDSDTRVIVFYLEGINDGRRFMEVAQRVHKKKPILVLKSGRTKEGAKATFSHTGALAINDQIFDAVCNQAGILRLESFGEIFELPKIFCYQPLPKGNRLGILTFTGGVGALAIDEACIQGLHPATLDFETLRELRSIYPYLGETVIDIGPPMAALKDYFSIYPKIIEAILRDKNIDCLFNVIWTGPSEEFVEEYIKIYYRLREINEKTIATWVYGPRVSLVQKMTFHLEDLGFPVFKDLEMAIKALALASRYHLMKKE